MKKININLHIEDLSFLFSKKKIQYLLSKGFIAGGFPRIVAKAIFKKKNVEKEVKDYLLKQKGDIDFFFSNEEDVNEVVNDLMIYKNIFAYEFETNIHCNDSWHSYLRSASCKVQVVSSFFFDNVLECFNSFDFENCKFAITKDKRSNYYLHCTNKSFDIMFNEDSNLYVTNGNSPLLLNRINKYLRKEEFTNISECSYELIKNNMFNIICSNWDDIYNPFFKVAFSKDKIDKNNIALFKDHIIKFNKNNMLTKELIILFIGKFSKTIYNRSCGYGQYFDVEEIDWATSELEEGNFNEI